MPGWLKVVLVGLAATGIALAVMVAFFVNAIGGMFDAFTGGLVSAGGDQGDGADEVRFLQTPGFDPEAQGAAVVLHPAFTGLPDPIAVTDPALIAAARDSAYFTDNRRAEGRMVLMSILFLSPPGNGTRATMASLFNEGREVATLTCYVGQCPRQGPPTAPYDLGGLAEAARPVSLETETITGIPEARTFEAGLLDDADVLLLNGTDALPPAAASFDGYVSLRLPSTFGPWDEMTAYQGEAEQAVFEAALAQVQADSGVAFEVTRSDASLSWTQYVIHEREPDRGVTDANGYPITDGWLPHIVPQARLWVAADEAGALREALLATDWPAPNDPPADALLDARLPQVLAAHDLPGAPGDYVHRTTVYDMVDGVTVSPFREPEVYFSYYRVAE